MTHTPTEIAADLCQVLLETYAVNERLNQIVLKHLDPAAWRAQLPGSRTRTVAAIVSHVHNIRRKWLRLSAPQLKLPEPLNRRECSQKQAQDALAVSGACCLEMLEEALCKPHSSIKAFHRDGWARPWPAGPAMLAYMLTHEAHHRGQICMLAHQLGFPLPAEAAQGLWAWERLWKESGFTHPR